jgi:hypothetical protein
MNAPVIALAGGNPRICCFDPAGLSNDRIMQCEFGNFTAGIRPEDGGRD